jgi:phosphonate transport system permease protein
MEAVIPARVDALVGSQRRAWMRGVIFIGIFMVPSLVSLAYVYLVEPIRLSKVIFALNDVLSRMIPPDFTDYKYWLTPLLNTFAMSLSGTFLAVLFGLPLGFLSARNATPHTLVYYFARLLLNVMRATPDLVAAIVFVAAFNLGPLAGAMALAFHSTGVLGKFFAEIIEHVDPAPIEAVRATGARPLQVIYHGYLALALPQLADAAIYRWECNFRNSMMLGMVGAGGIGFELFMAFNYRHYPVVLAITILIVALVTVVDSLGAKLRVAIK